MTLLDAPIEVAAPGQIHRAGDVTRARVDGLHISAVPLSCARIDEQAASTLVEQRFDIGDIHHHVGVTHELEQRCRSLDRLFARERSGPSL